ncbi:MAG TPA: nucleotidyltransferase family protein [Gaiellaceae bacterium]
MKAIVLAAGYATRLYPLTESRAKPLLPVGGRPMLDYIIDALDEVPEIDAVHVATNHKFADSFAQWAAERVHGRVRPVIHDDLTMSEDDRLGAIGAVRFVLDEAGLEGDDLLVVAGDNLFDFSLDEYVRWWREKGEASAVALYDVGDLALARKYGIVAVAADERIESFEEKPERPRSTLAATAAYLYHRAHVPFVHRYLAEGNSPDQPGRFIAWLHTRAPVFGHRVEGEWRDIGDVDQLLEADSRLRERAGLPARDSYTPE